MKLYDIPEGSKIKAECSDGSEYLIFHHLDGMYSYCKSEKGGVIHLSGGTPLRAVEDYYVIDEKGDDN